MAAGLIRNPWKDEPCRNILAFPEGVLVTHMLGGAAMLNVVELGTVSSMNGDGAALVLATDAYNQTHLS